jgi:hypothetical protein
VFPPFTDVLDFAHKQPAITALVIIAVCRRLGSRIPFALNGAGNMVTKTVGVALKLRERNRAQWLDHKEKMTEIDNRRSRPVSRAQGLSSFYRPGQ